MKNEDKQAQNHLPRSKNQNLVLVCECAGQILQLTNANRVPRIVNVVSEPILAHLVDLIQFKEEIARDMANIHNDLPRVSQTVKLQQ
jgi:hypothetical protein